MIHSPRPAARPAGALALVALVVLGLALVVAPATSFAQPQPASPVKVAAKHFQRGVALYNEADYRAALVEFRRAYEVAPNAAVLYNLGQTHYQLQNYAASLITFERYLTEAGDKASHRAEVEASLEILRTRVGKLELSASMDGCELTIDDEVVGKTPLPEPVLVSIGRRKVVSLCEGRTPETRVVEVAAGDTVKVVFTVPLAEPAASAPAARLTQPAPRQPSTNWTRVGWISTGVLGAGALGAGVLAFLASRDLQSARDSYPVSPATLDSKASKVSRYALVADLLGAATVVAGGLTLTYTLTRSPEREVAVALSPVGVALTGTFR